MKANLVTVFLLIFACHYGYSQRIHFEQDSLEAVIAKARQFQKPIFIFVSGPEIPNHVPKQMREQMAGSGFDHAEVTEAYNTQFINFKAPYRSAVGNRLSLKFSIRAFPTFLYLSPEGVLIHRNHGNYSSPKRYLDDIRSFEERLNSTYNLDHFGQEYQKGRRDADFLRQYLQLHKEMGVEPTAALLDAYAGSLSAAGIRSFSEVIFIHEFGPLVGGEAFKFARQDQRLVDSLYKSLPLAKRVDINNKIIMNTMREAITTNDRRIAEQGAGFARHTWSNDKVRGHRTYLSNMLSFYRGTSDTANYIPSAVQYYNRYFMAISQDSAATLVATEKRLQQSRMASGAAMSEKMKAVGTQQETRTETRFEAVVSSYTMELNNAAYHMYQTGTRNKAALNQALNWSKRTIDLDPTVAYYHTYAHLLYRLEDYKGVESAMQQAIKLSKQTKSETSWLQEALQKMKLRKL
ncbi:hypothetical protein [Pontibacter ramchanderi]|uniref:Thioredoxin-like protein n=1 Tax=Pontibacter ramchanderi TaxID=1179743 RepID=A0A2N3V1R0_9BACT|nr:hypothetical protein [Pontibacter ramchanderi]PKV75569.1 hypothetical protein BD749_0514 [Pontibacter ramchanderi]